MEECARMSWVEQSCLCERLIRAKESGKCCGSPGPWNLDITEKQEQDVKVAARGVGCGETKLRNSNKMFGGESEVKERLLSAQVGHCISTRRMFSKLPKGREVQPTGDLPWCNQVRSVLIVLHFHVLCCSFKAHSFLC